MRRLMAKEEPPTLLGRLQKLLTSQYAINLALGAAVVCVTYAFAVTRYHLSHVTLLERLHTAELEYGKLLQVNPTPKP